MKMTQVVRRRLALLMSALMIITSMPMNAMAALDSGEVDGAKWAVSVDEVKFADDTLEEGGETTLTLTVSSDVTPAPASAPNASAANAAAAASAADALKTVIGKITKDSIELTGNGEIEYVGGPASKGNTVTFKVKAVKAGKVTATIDGKEDTLTVVAAPEKPKITAITAKPTSVEIDLAKTTTATVEFTATVEGEATEELYKEFAEGFAVTVGDTKVATVVKDVKDDVATVTVTGVAVGTTTLTATYGELKPVEVKVTVTKTEEQPPVEPTITGIEADKSEVTIDLTTDVKTATVKITAKVNGDPTDALYETFKKDLKVNVNKTDVATATTTFDKGVATVTVTGVAAGTATLTATYGDSTRRVTITVKDEEEDEPTPVAPKITGITADPTEVAIDLAKAATATVKVTATIEGTATEDTYKTFADGLALKVADEKVATAKASFDKNVATVTVTGVAAGTTTLTATIGASTATVKVTVTAKPSEEPVEVAPAPQAPSIADDAVPAADDIEGYDGLTDEQKKAVEEALDAIVEELKKGEATVTLDADQTEALAAMFAGSETVTVEPTVEVTKINVKLNDKNLPVVVSMRTNIDVIVVVDGKEEGSLPALLKDDKYVSVVVPMPSTREDGYDWVKWDHYADDAATEIDNTPLKGATAKDSDIRSEIKDDKATLTTKSFSPFDLTFENSDTPAVTPTPTPGTSSGFSPTGYSRVAGNETAAAAAATGEWVKDEIGWWYRNADGTWPANGWAQLTWNGKLDWYYFNADGYMVTGWITVDGLKYYLHPVSDGTQGHMYSGWQVIDGKYYYFSEVHDGTFGHLLVSTTTPDGYQVDADGVWIQ